MSPHTPEEFSTRLIDWSPFVIMGNTMPPRDPDEDEEDEDEEEKRTRRRTAGRARTGRRLEHDAFRIGHSLSFGNSWRNGWRKCSEDFADCDADGFGRARGGLAQ